MAQVTKEQFDELYKFYGEGLEIDALAKTINGSFSISFNFGTGTDIDALITLKLNNENVFNVYLPFYKFSKESVRENLDKARAIISDTTERVKAEIAAHEERIKQLKERLNG